MSNEKNGDPLVNSKILEESDDELTSGYIEINDNPEVAIRKVRVLPEDQQPESIDAPMKPQDHSHIETGDVFEIQSIEEGHYHESSNSWIGPRIKLKGVDQLFHPAQFKEAEGDYKEPQPLDPEWLEKFKTFCHERFYIGKEDPKYDEDFLGFGNSLHEIEHIEVLIEAIKDLKEDLEARRRKCFEFARQLQKEKQKNSQLEADAQELNKAIENALSESQKLSRFKVPEDIANIVGNILDELKSTTRLSEITVPGDFI